MHSVTPAGDMCWTSTFFPDLSQPLIILKDHLCACVSFPFFFMLFYQSASSPVSACLSVCFPHLSRFLFIMPVILSLITSLFLCLLAAAASSMDILPLLCSHLILIGTWKYHVICITYVLFPPNYTDKPNKPDETSQAHRTSCLLVSLLDHDQS